MSIRHAVCAVCAILLLRCGGESDKDGVHGAGGSASPTAGNGGDTAGQPGIGGRTMTSMASCVSCLPSCGMSAPETADMLCAYANGALILRTRYDDCPDQRFSEINWNRAQVFTVKDEGVTGCVATSPMGSNSAGDPELSPECNAASARQCTLCPERSDPYLVDTYGAPLCTDAPP